MTEAPVVGVVLAAGLSSRMGTPKQLLDWRGSPLVAYQARQLADAGAATVIVVTGHAAAAVTAALAGVAARPVHNPQFQSGRASSLRVAAEAIGGTPSAIVLLNVDQPRRATTLARLLQAHLAGDALITVPSFDGKRGHPIVVSGSLLPELRHVTDADEGLRAVVRRYTDRRRELPFDDDEVLLDLNDAATYDAARQTWDSTTTR